MAPGQTASDHGRFRLVDSMRALAALSIVYYHVAFRFPPPPLYSFQEYLTQRSAGPPATAVVLFFVVSGFVLYRPFVAARFAGRPMPALFPYFVRRVARIVPAYWVALTVVSIWLGYSYVFTPHGLVRFYGFLQLYAGHSVAGGGISVAWTLCVEVSFYLALPLLALGARALGGRALGGRLSLIRSEFALCALMALTSLAWQLAITIAVPESSSWFLSLLSMLPGGLDLFAAGMLLAVLSVEHEHRPVPRPWVRFAERRAWPFWLLALALLYGEGRVPGTLQITGWWLSTHALKLLACALMMAPLCVGSAQRGLIRRFLGAPPIVWLGTVSYGIYLWHYPVLTKLAPDLTGHGLLYTTAVMFAVSIAFGGLSFYLIERPSQALARRFLAARRSRAAAIPPVAVAVVAPVSAPPPDHP